MYLQQVRKGVLNVLLAYAYPEHAINSLRPHIYVGVLSSVSFRACTSRLTCPVF
jgi:hypothetical protein